jgi:hypothetical protein
MSEDESVDEGEGEGESGRETEGEFWFWFRLDLNLDSKCRWGATVAEASVRGASVMEPSTRKRKENTRFITKSIWDMKLSWNKSASFEICCVKNSCHKFRFLLFETIFFLSIVLRNFTFSVIYYSKFNFSTFLFRTFTLSKFYPSTFFFNLFAFENFSFDVWSVIRHEFWQGNYMYSQINNICYILLRETWCLMFYWFFENENQVIEFDLILTEN